METIREKNGKGKLFIVFRVIKYQMFIYLSSKRYKEAPFILYPICWPNKLFVQFTLEDMLLETRKFQKSLLSNLRTPTFSWTV